MRHTERATFVLPVACKITHGIDLLLTSFIEFLRDVLVALLVQLISRVIADGRECLDQGGLGRGGLVRRRCLGRRHVDTRLVREGLCLHSWGLHMNISRLIANSRGRGAWGLWRAPTLSTAMFVRTCWQMVGWTSR